MSLSNVTDILTKMFFHIFAVKCKIVKEVVESHTETKRTYKISQKMFILTKNNKS